MGLNLKFCYIHAWKGFSKAWAVLCLISSFIVVFNLIPRIMVHPQFALMKNTFVDFSDAVLKDDRVTASLLASAIQEQIVYFTGRIVKIGLILFPVVALLTILLIMHANQAVKLEKSARKSFADLAWIALVHVILAIIKCFAFFLLIVPGIILYVRLFFVPLLLLEENISVKIALRKSWRLTRGHFFKLFLLIFYNTLIQIAAMFTIIGLIPVNGFINTVRAAAFHMLYEKNQRQAAEPGLR